MLRHADAVVVVPHLPARRHARDGRARRAPAAADPRRGRPAGDRSGRPSRRWSAATSSSPSTACSAGSPTTPRTSKRARAACRPGMFISNPFTDVPERPDERRRRRPMATPTEPPRGARPGRGLLGGPRADAAAARLARGGGRRSAIETTEGTVILTDAADATSSGATGDSNAILRALREAGYAGTVLAPIVDAPAVEAAFAAGVGGRSGRPSAAGSIRRASRRCRSRGAVHMLSEGRFASESDGNVWFGGRTAVLKGDTSHARRDEPGGHALRPLAVPRPRPGSHGGSMRSSSSRRTASRNVRRLGGAGREHRCAGRDQRQPAEPRPHRLPAADLPARRRRDVHARWSSSTRGRATGVQTDARRERASVKIREIVAVGLSGDTPEGGWSNELTLRDSSVHTLVAVVTEEGPVGYGSAFTNVDLVQGRARPARAAVPRALPPSNPSGRARSCTRTRSGSAAAGR